MTPEKVREILAEVNPAAMVCEGYDAALVGVAYRAGMAAPVAAYSSQAFIGLIVEQGATPEEAVEHFGFNVIGAYVGDHTPIFLDVGVGLEGAHKDKAPGSRPTDVGLEIPGE